MDTNVPSVVPPDPAVADHPEAFVEQLSRLRLWAGQPSLRRLQRLGGKRRTSNGDVLDALPTSTVSYLLRRAELPRLDFVEAFTTACLRAAGCPAEDIGPLVQRWRRAWRRLADQDRRAQAGPEQRPAAPAPAEPAAPCRHLPPDIGDFIGRGSQLRTLFELIPAVGATATAICVIQGMAGVGKTRLAIHAGHELAATGRFDDAILYVDLYGFSQDRPPADPAAVLADLLRLLGVPAAQIPAGPQARAALFRDHLHDRRTLVILDDAADERQVLPLLPHSPTCLVLVTSRRQLAIDGSCRLGLDVFSTEEAVEAFTRIAGPARAASSPADVARVVHLCGHLPIAVALAARRLSARPAWDLPDLVGRLEENSRRLSELAAGTRDVQSVFDVSYQILTAEQQRMFRLLSLHPGQDATAPSAAALVDASPQHAEALLEALLDQHLLQQRTHGRYYFHDLLRAYARERAEAEELPRDRAIARHRVLSWYLHAADAANRELFPLGRHQRPDPTHAPRHPPVFAGRAPAMDFFVAEHHNLVAAVRLATDHALPKIAWQLPAAMWGFFLLHKHWDDWIATHRTALAAARNGADRAGQAVILNLLGVAYCDLHRFDLTLRHCEQALAIQRALGDQRGQGITLTTLGIAHTELDQYEQARACHQRALAAFRLAGDRRGQALALNSLAETYRRLGRRRQATRHLGHALAIQREIGDRHSQRLTHATLGAVYYDRKEYETALDHYYRALAGCRDLGDDWTAGRILTELGRTMYARGEIAEAHALWRKAITTFDRLGDTRSAADVRSLLRSECLS